MVPQAFNDVIANGMAKNVDDRHATTTELAVAARAALTDQHPGGDGPTRSEAWEHSAATLQAPQRPYRPDAPAFAATEYRDTVAAARAPLADTVRTHPLRRPSVVVPAVVAVVVLVVAGVFIASRSSDDSVPAAADGTKETPTTSAVPAGPVFDGTYELSFGPRTSLAGKPQDTVADPVTWVVRSSCDRTDCVASATTVNRKAGVLSYTFDFVDGKWLSVVEVPDSKCQDKTDPSFRRYTLTPQPDGSFSGEVVVANTIGGCNSRYPVTARRTGDADPAVQVADPAVMPPRVRSPAEGFKGRYHSVQQYTSTEQTDTKFEDETVIETLCLRGGDRCLTTVYDSDSFRTIEYANQQWTLKATNYGTCSGSGTPKETIWSEVYPLPTPTTDPIATVAGKGTSEVISEGCRGGGEYDQTYTRTGD